MANERKGKSLAYKRVELSNNAGGATFQDLLSDALKRVSKVVDREEEFVNGHIRLLGKINENNSFLCGQLFLYEKGKNIAFIVEGENEVEIEDISPLDPNEQDKKREVLQGSLFFCSFENHLIISQTQTVNSKNLETHLTWLLKDATSTLASDSFLCLADEPTKQAKEIFAGKSVKSVNVGTPLSMNDSNEISSTKRVRAFAPGIEVLRTLLQGTMNERLIDNLDDANMEVTVEVKYKRTTTQKGHDYLDQLARSFRHLDPEDTLIETTDGIKLKGDKLRLTERIRVDHYNGIPDTNQVYEGMRSWLITLIKSGTLE